MSIIKKAFTYRILSFFLTLTIAFVFTGKYDVSVLVALTELAAKTILYCAFERWWGDK